MSDGTRGPRLTLTPEMAVDPWRTGGLAASPEEPAPPVSAPAPPARPARPGGSRHASSRPAAAEPRRGAASAATSPASRMARAANVPYFLVVVAGTAGLAWVWQGGAHHVRGGTLAMAGAVFVAALARLVLPESWAGMLASRARFVDVVTLAALAAGLLAAGLVLPTPS